MKTQAMAFLAAAAIGGPAAAQTAPNGEMLFKQRCGTCHAIDAGGAAKLGPPLRGVAGRKAGAVAGYAYSAALKGSGVVWDKANLDAYLARPTARIPGTKMMLGVPAIDQRAAIISYLATQK